jgi:hypothetical protein
MKLSQPPHFPDIIHVQIDSKAGIFEPALQRQNHGFGHAGIGEPGVYIQVEIEFLGSRQTHHASVYHEDIGTVRPGGQTYVRRELESFQMRSGASVFGNSRRNRNH